MEHKQKIKNLWVFLPLSLMMFVLIVSSILLVVFLIKILWAWTVPAIFPLAVKQNLVAGKISWFTSFKLLIAAVVIARLVGIRPESNKKVGPFLKNKFGKYFRAWDKDGE